MADEASEFEAHRRRLFGLAYRMLGSASEAEDVVQEAFLRWAGADRTTIRNAAAWLNAAVTRLCLQELESARKRRERYIGPWLPEPVLTSDAALGPLETMEQRESVSYALLLLLERLTPQERAVFVLREAFGYRHREIAEVLSTSEANCRQLHRRARQRVGQPRARFSPAPEKRDQLARAFLRATQEGDVAEVERLLAHDATSTTDGGGRVKAPRRTIVGPGRIARYHAHLASTYRRTASRRVEINGEPGLLVWLDGTLFAAVVIEVREGRIGGVRLVANPDKLAFAARQAAGLSAR